MGALDSDRGRLLGCLAAVGGAGLLAGAWLLSPELVLRPGAGDWRSPSMGLRRAAEPGILTGGRRALIHFHDLTDEGSTLGLLVSSRGPADPVRLAIEREGDPLFVLDPPSDEPTRVHVPTRGGARSLDVVLRAEPLSPGSRGGYRIHEIRLSRKAGTARRLAQLLPALLGAAVLAALWRKGARRLAVLWAVLAVLGTLGAAVQWDPSSGLRVGETAGTILPWAWILVVWAAALARPSRAAALAALAGTVGAFYLPTVHYGFVNEDFNFAHPWSAAELGATLHGSWDPRGGVEAYFRPLVAASLALDHSWWGDDPRGYHLTNLAIHFLGGAVAALLLRRLGLSARGALGGALAWAAHPLAATAVAWTNQRTDGLAALFSLAALAVLLRPPLSAAWAAACVGLGVLALGSKEMAVTLPLAAIACVWAAGGGFAGRKRTLCVLAAVVVAYVALWAVLFPEKVWARTGTSFRWEGLEGGLAGLRWPLLVPALYSLVFLPMDYEGWQSLPLEGLSPLYLMLGALAPLLAALLLWREAGGAPARRVALLGLCWPLLTILPILAIREVDVFRLGLLVCFAFALVWGALLTRAEQRRPYLAVGLGVVALAALAGPARRTAAAWGPGGFMKAELRGWRAHVGGPWWRTLTPAMQRLFEEEVARPGHESRLLDR